MTNRCIIKRTILDKGDLGATIEELAERHGMTPQQVAAPLSILHLSGQIKLNGFARGNGLAGPCPIYVVERITA